MFRYITTLKSAIPASAIHSHSYFCSGLPTLPLSLSFLFSLDVLAVTSGSAVCLSPSRFFFLVPNGGLGGLLQIGTQMNNASKAKAESWGWVQLSCQTLFQCVTVR